MKSEIFEIEITNSRIVVASLVALLCGVAMVVLWKLPTWFWLVFLCAFIFILIYRKNKLMMCLFFCLVAFGAGAWRANSALGTIATNDFGEFSGKARVERGTESKQKYQRVVIRPVDGEKFGGQKFVAFANHHPKFEVGDILDVQCDLQMPKNKHEKFDYQRFLAKDGIAQVCSGAKMQKTGQSSLGFVGRVLLGAKKSLEQKVNMLFPQPEAGYLGGLLLGGSDRLPVDVAEQFRRTGTTHTVAVSGYNITILAGVLMAIGIAVGFWRQQAFWLAVMGIAFFVLMIGSPASAVRAAIMGVLVLWAAKHGRLANSGNAIIFSAAVMVWFSPLILLHDVGFQLSFLATIGIVSIYGPLSEKAKIKNDFLELKSILLVTVAAQLGVLGILIYTFETFSPISLLANMVILPLIPYLMLGGFVAVLTSFVLPSLAHLLAQVVWLGLHFEIKAVELLSQISWSLIDIENVGIAWLICYYIFLFLLVLHLRRGGMVKV